MQVYTAIFGEYDQLKKQPKQTVEADFICYTDGNQFQEGWTTIKNKSLQHLHPRLQAKFFRTHPSQDCTIAVRIDGSCQIKDENFLKDIAKQLNDKGVNILTFKHPVRDCILEEANFSMSMPKYQGLPLLRQALHYIGQGYPKHHGLSATGMLAMKLTPELRNMLNDWRLQNLQWSYQDQISFDYMIWKHEIKHARFTNIEGEYEKLRENKYVDFLNPHTSEY